MSFLSPFAIKSTQTYSKCLIYAEWIGHIDIEIMLSGSCELKIYLRATEFIGQSEVLLAGLAHSAFELGGVSIFCVEAHNGSLVLLW